MISLNIILYQTYAVAVSEFDGRLLPAATKIKRIAVVWRGPCTR